MNLVSHTMGDGISSVAWSRGVSKPEKPTQGAPARAECPAPRRNPLPTARTARKTHRSFNDRRVPYDGQAGAAIGCSVSSSVFSHRLPSLRTHALMAPNSNPRQLSRRTFSFDNCLEFEAAFMGCKLEFQLCKVGFEGVK